MSKFPPMELEDEQRIGKMTEDLTDHLNNLAFKTPLEILVVLHAVQQAILVSLYDHMTDDEENPNADQADQQGTEAEGLPKQPDENLGLRRRLGR